MYIAQSSFWFDTLRSGHIINVHPLASARPLVALLIPPRYVFSLGSLSHHSAIAHCVPLRQPHDAVYFVSTGLSARNSSVAYGHRSLPLVMIAILHFMKTAVHCRLFHVALMLPPAATLVLAAQLRQYRNGCYS